MAQQTVKLYARTWGYTDSGTPVGVIDLSNKTEIAMNMWTGAAPNWTGSELFFTIDQFPSALSKKRIYYAKAKFAFRGFGQVTKYMMMHSRGTFDPATLEYSNKPALYGPNNLKTEDISGGYSSTYSDYDLNPDPATAAALSASTCALLRYPTHVLLQYKSPSGGYSKTTGYAKLRTLSDNSSLPYIEITYDDSISIGSNIRVANAPTSGYVNPRESTSFTWIYEKDTSSGYDCYGEDYGQSSATFYWKTSSDETYTAVQISGATQGVTIPANTFPIGSTVQWYVEGTDDGGTTSQTDVYSFSTSAGAVTATPVSPKNTIESNNSPITFRWNYSSPDGFAPSRYKFMWKLASSSEWTALVDSTDVVNEYTFPAYTFPAGEIRWEVVPYNIDGVQGTGTSTTFICFGAPEAPVVSAESTPFSTVTWQASDQQAYKIKVDDVVYGAYFGTEKSFKIPDKLEDGEHRISVAVIGTYALWSEWGTSVITVQNEPGESITLSGNGDIENHLNWMTEETTSDFLIYRDDVEIGHTLGNGFNDRFAVGEHTYKVINRLPDGNYSESNEVTITAEADGTYISLLRGGEWLKIKYRLKDASDQQYTESIETVYNHLAGDDYPSVSISRFKERSLKYSAVFLYVDEEDHTKFKNMLRKPVIMKFENGNMIIGVIDSWTRLHRKNYYTAYTFSLRSIEWEDYVDDTT